MLDFAVKTSACFSWTCSKFLGFLDVQQKSGYWISNGTSAGHASSLGISKDFNRNLQIFLVGFHTLTSAPKNVFFFFRGIDFGSKTSQISEGFGWNLQKFYIFWPQINARKKTTFFFFNYKFLSQIFQWYILVFFGCCCCSPCSSGGCWWYPCHGSHLIGECATHCCVGISSSKGVGRSYWQDYVFVGAWNEKGRSILPKTIWFWVETEYLAHSLPILPSSAGAWPSLCSHCSSGPRKWWPRSGAVAKFGGTYMFSIHYGCIFV